MLPTPHSFDPSSLVGTTFDGRYRIVAHLATGGMGSVYRAEHVYMRKPLAVKVLRPELSAMPDLAERFRREAEIVASLEHENIVRVTDFGRTVDGWLFLVMELLEGESLYDRLSQGLKVEPEETIRILVQVCRGLDAAHRRGVVHRDLKPENIFLTTSGTVKVLDFGIAKLTDSALPGQTQAGIVVGTPEYLSPEQASGGTVDSRADLYSVGVIGWRMLAGRHPFGASDARGLILMHATQPFPSLIEERPELAAWGPLVTVLDQACAKDPEQRTPSAAELAAALEACGPTDEIVSRRTTPTRIAPAPPAVQRRGVLRTAILTAVVTIALGALGTGAVAFAHWSEQRSEQRLLAQARELLAASRPEEARDVIARALSKRPADPTLLALQGKALHRIAGQSEAALVAYGSALDADPHALDAAALADLESDLRDPSLADRAAQLLARTGSAAFPIIVAATKTGPASSRLRALDLARETGAHDRIDPVAELAKLLDDPDCSIRRAAILRLADIGTDKALERLESLAGQTRHVRGLFGFPQNVPVCGAQEAAAALKKSGHHPDH